MSDIKTISRPYAKAIFELALASKQLAGWSALLSGLTQAILLPETVQFIQNPATTADEQIRLLMTVTERMTMPIEQNLIQRFVSLLVENKRLLLIPGIASEYETLKAEQEKTLTVSVRSFTPLSNTQQQKLVEKLTQRLQRQVALEMSIDESLLGGALIQAGDLVIDGSVRGQLSNLASHLTE